MRALLLLVAFVAYAHAQTSSCSPATAILRLMGGDQACMMAPAIAECSQKMAVQTYSCTATGRIQSDLAVAQDGSYCSPSQGLMQGRGDALNGKYILGRSDLEYTMRANVPNNVLMMNIKGRVVPAGGGREIPYDCNMVFNVTGGGALGIVSQGSDSLMQASFQGGAGGYTGGAAGMGGTAGSTRGGAGSGGPGGMGQAEKPGGRTRGNAAGAAAAAGRILAAAGAAGLLLPLLL